MTQSTEGVRSIRIIGVEGIPRIRPGDNLAKIIVDAVMRQGLEIEDGDILVVASKIVSKAEGKLVELDLVSPSNWAREIANRLDKDPRLIEVILGEAKRIVKMNHGVLITETRTGIVCANSGVDLSNVSGGDVASLLPSDPDRSAKSIRGDLKKLLGVDTAVIISDTYGRPWRLGHVNFAIGVDGMYPTRDYRGENDLYGYKLRVTTIAVADELASAAELAMGKNNGVPVVLIKGYAFLRGEGSARDLVRPRELDLFR